ncbi:hypothetical protein Poli38472_006291 [Pythium oligandrum]|uniref:NYN domain-containing protein n=1 Tax=Pythium oligandrum TaxID=41045 RepID=A0A8K1CTU5_PYTOL|nr:hypothetical protein Poli38472_006291 [Pythium oligandrum]|eukprot:TMW68823.1 hypothetical protein Poli38472_006291 [Pythium oligandrum]
MADTPAPATENACRTVLVIDGAYAHIGARNMPGGRIDYVKFREVLERQAACRFRECWFFDQEPIRHKSPTQGLSAQYTALKLAPPQGPQFQLKLYAMKKYACHCRRCGHQFTQNVQKGVDNGIATKILSLAYENVCDRFILFAGDGDFYDSLNLIKNVLRKDLWVIGFRDTVSADLQQLASHVIWLNDVWPSVQVNTPVPQPAQATQPEHNQTGPSQQPPSQAQAPLVPPPPPVSRTHSATSSSGSQLPPYPPVVDTTDKDEDMLASTANPRRRRRGNTERQIEVTSDSGSRGGRGKGRDRRRNGGRNGGPVLQPPANEAEGESEREADEAWFFFDKSGMGHEAAVLPAAACTTSEKKNADEERGNGRNGNGKKRFERSPPKRKRRRQDPQPLTFELSDMSSEEDEQPPGLSHHQPVAAPTPATASNQDSVMIIDLASDSDSS